MSFIVFDLETVNDAAWSPAPDKPDDFPPPWACRVVCIGFANLSYDFELKKCGTMIGPGPEAQITDEQREAELLRSFSNAITAMDPKARTLVTYNGRRFDLPVLASRSMRHVIPMPWWFANENSRKRYAIKSHVDLCDQISEYGAARNVSLDAIAKTVGLPGKTEDGSKVGEMFARGEIDRIRRYCLDDVAQTAVLLLRFVAMRGNIKPATGLSYAATVLELQAKLVADFQKQGALKRRLDIDEAKAISAFDNYSDQLRAMGIGDGAKPAVAVEDDFG